MEVTVADFNIRKRVGLASLLTCLGFLPLCLLTSNLSRALRHRARKALFGWHCCELYVGALETWYTVKTGLSSHRQFCKFFRDPSPPHNWKSFILNSLNLGWGSSKPAIAHSLSCKESSDALHILSADVSSSLQGPLWTDPR